MEIKYKVYSVVFVICLLSMISVFGGITDSEAECKDEHVLLDDVIILDKIVSNGNAVQFEVKYAGYCRNYAWDSCDEECDDDGREYQGQFSLSVQYTDLNGVVKRADMLWNDTERRFLSPELQLQKNTQTLTFTSIHNTGADSTDHSGTTTRTFTPPTTSLDGTYLVSDAEEFCNGTKTGFVFSGTTAITFSGLNYTIIGAANIGGVASPCNDDEWNLTSIPSGGAIEYLESEEKIRYMYEKEGTTVYIEFIFREVSENSYIMEYEDGGYKYTVKLDKTK